MTGPAAFQVVELFERAGFRMGSVAVPCTPHPPLLIQWGNKFFIRPVGEMRYFLVECYLVPLQDMYEQPQRQSKPHDL